MHGAAAEREDRRDKDRQGEWKGEQLAGRRQKERDVFFSSREPKGGGFKIDLQRGVMLRVFGGREGGRIQGAASLMRASLVLQQGGDRGKVSFPWSKMIKKATPEKLRGRGEGGKKKL